MPSTGDFRIFWRRAAAVAALLTISLVDGISPHAGEWSNSRGGPERDGARPGVAALERPQVAWRQRLGGNLSGAAMWAREAGEPAAYLSLAGRVEAKRWDDAPLWRSEASGFDRILAAADFDGNGTGETLIAAGVSAGPIVGAITDAGEVAWSVTSGDNATRGFGVRVIDIDDDKIPEIFVSPLLVGLDEPRMRMYRFPAGPSSAQLVYEVPIERDYVAGFFDVIGEFDGTPGLELVAEGRSTLYVYDAATGMLESTSVDVGPLPLGRATLRPIDVDGDGVSELIAYSNEAWAPAQNRRHVSLYGWDAATQKLVVRWSRDVLDVANDRVSFADNSAIDLDGDGSLEVVFAIYDAAQGHWITEILDARSGNPLATIAGERFEAVVTLPGQAAKLVATHDEGQPLKLYRFGRSFGVSLAGQTGDLEVAYCREQVAILADASRSVPCRIRRGGVPGSGLVLVERAPGGRDVIGLRSIDLADDSYPLAGLFAAGDDYISSQLVINGGSSMAIAVALTSGRILPLDADLRPIPSVSDDVGYRGILFGSQFAGNDVVSYPLIAADLENESILAIAGGRRAMLLDARLGASIGGGISPRWIHRGVDRAVISDGPPQLVILFDESNGVRALRTADGESEWSADGMLDAGEGLILHLDPLLVPSPAGDRVWFHRRDQNRGAYDLTVLDAVSGDTLISRPDIAFNNSGWKRLTLGTVQGVQTPISGPLSETWFFDGPSGATIATRAGEQTPIAMPVTLTGRSAVLLSGRTKLELLDAPSGEILWSLDNPNGASQRLGALVSVDGDLRYATTSGDRPVLRLIDVSSGSVAGNVILENGEIVAQESATRPALGNITAIEDLVGDGQPAFLVGSTDGFLYALDARDAGLKWSMNLGAPVGEIVTSDWDGDGLLELVVSTADGALVGIDSFSGDAPAWVHDTNGISTDDVDELATSSTLYAAWSEVSDAADYAVAVFRNDGSMVRDFRRVGRVTSTTIETLPLEGGVRYVVSVRAISSVGTSPDAASNGVTVLAAGSPVGGCCGVGRRAPPGDLLLVLGSLWLLRRRREHGSQV